VAYDLLRAVAERDAYANLALPALLRERRLTGRDAAFATELAYGALRGRGTYDAVLGACVDRPLDALDPPVLDVLRIGAHQLLATRVPAHAAVAATVALARANLTSGPAGLVNAVLRRVAERDLDRWLADVAPDQASDPDGHLAVVTSHPGWVVRALRDALHADARPASELLELLRADNAAPHVTLVARPGQAERDELVAAGAKPGRWSPYAATLPGGDPARVPAVAAGRAGVQDEGSQLVALGLLAVPVEGAELRWADLCAGPGGKAALLAGLGAAVGAELTAVEVAEHRAELVRRALAGTGGTVGTVGRWRVETGDGREIGAEVAAGARAPYDRVLVDVPCTGLGALRRRPEARWRRQPSDVAALGRVQRELLAAALDATRAGGVVGYATCSPHVAETRVVVEDVCRRRRDVEVLDTGAALRAVAPGLPLGPGPYAQLWPHVHGTDAMFLALLRRH
jgi:16S rRNA (cytosine967-C5)-methyltransferase